MHNAFALQTREVKSNISGAQSNFRIDNNAFMFKALSDSLYRNKIRAVIREYRNNAWDAHIETVQERAVELHLPTHEELWFEVKDYGTGLSPDDVINLFSTYGASDKRGDDAINQIGGFGLGSKSGFAYADQFTVSTRWNGTEYQYICYKDAKSLPIVQLVEQRETTEPNGLTVRIGVRGSDISAFNTNYYEIRKWCDRSDLLNTDFKLPEPINKTFAGDNWYFTRDVNGPSVLLGNVLYPLDFDSLPSVSNRVKLLKDERFVLVFGAKDLSPAPSREDLSYDRMTVKNLTNAMNKAIDSIEAHAKSLVNDDMTHFTAKQIIDRAFAQSHLLRRFANPLWRGIDLKKPHILGDNYLASVQEVDSLDENLRAFSFTSRGHADKFERVELGCFNRHANYQNLETIVWTPSVTKEMYRQRVVKFLEDRGYDMREDGDKFMWFAGPWHQFLLWRREAGNPPASMIHTPDNLPTTDDVRAVRKARSGPRAQAMPYRIDGTNLTCYGYTKSFKRVQVNMDDGGYYVKSEGYLVHNARLIEQVMRCVPKYGAGKIYAVSKSLHKMFDEHPKWINVIDAVKPDIVQYVKDNLVDDEHEDIRLDFSRQWSLNNLVISYLECYENMVKPRKPTNANNIPQEFVYYLGCNMPKPKRDDTQFKLDKAFAARYNELQDKYSFLDRNASGANRQKCLRVIQAFEKGVLK